MVVYEVDVSSSPISVYRDGPSNPAVAEGLGLEISGADVSLIEPGFLAVRGDRLQVEERGRTVHITSKPSPGFGGML